MSLCGSVMETMILAWPLVGLGPHVCTLITHLGTLFTCFLCRFCSIKSNYPCDSVWVCVAPYFSWEGLFSHCLGHFFYSMVMICHVLLREFGVTKATVESTYISAVLSIHISDCRFQIIQQWPNNCVCRIHAHKPQVWRHINSEHWFEAHGVTSVFPQRKESNIAIRGQSLLRLCLNKSLIIKGD